MSYLEEIISLENEWEDIRVSGEEYARIINENPERKEKKKKEILTYREKIVNSTLANEEKERRLKEIRENFSYLNSNDQDGEFFKGILLGVMFTILGMYGIDRLKNYLKEELSESILKGLYSQL